MTFNEKLHKERVKRDMTQEEFAKMLSISQPALSAYESGERQPPFERAKSIAKFLGIPLSELFPKYKF